MLSIQIRLEDIVEQVTRLGVTVQEVSDELAQRRQVQDEFLAAIDTGDHRQPIEEEIEGFMDTLPIRLQNFLDDNGYDIEELIVDYVLHGQS